MRGDAKQVTTELDAFQLFMTPEIIEDITRRTNNALEQVRQSQVAVLADSTWKKSHIATSL